MKLIVEILKDEQIVLSKEYKSLKAVQQDYPQIEYHQLRAIYLYYTAKPEDQKKFLHSRTSDLIKLFRITPIEIGLTVVVA